jgi:hypothetical protein
MGGKGLVYNELLHFCFFVFLRVRSNNVVLVILGFIHFSTLVRVFLCLILKVWLMLLFKLCVYYRALGGQLYKLGISNAM